MNISIAIDGPAGAGKSTIAKLVGDRYSLMYINTGAMYRAVTLKAMQNNIKPDNTEELVELINNLDMHFQGEKLIVNGQDVTEEIYMPIISKNVSYYSTIKEVREKLVELQRRIAQKYSVIMDGRDIGTVVLKDAKLKIFLTASAETRANRRYKELEEKGIEVNYEEILEDIKKRDYIDSNREISPLTKAEDAIEIDSSNLDIPGVVDKISYYIDGIKK
ncbi:(d)CMP kinase [Haloimpatiens lingqiaonensis]|uniref:(d)CMP kinase n=1 Tax=Haloimpatiens lingqiaonensis TaxID=1380675 RepID=UPI0010FD85F0|nr:(d)CMP kinase [Haloimpatiens lingqiaonensis]